MAVGPWLLEPGVFIFSFQLQGGGGGGRLEGGGRRLETQKPTRAGLNQIGAESDL